MTALHVSQPALLIRDAAAITAEWLSEVLGLEQLSLLDVQRIGTGQMSHTYRASYSADGDRGTVVVKLASDDPNIRMAAGVGAGPYYCEVSFYQRLGDRFDGQIPRFFLAEHEPEGGWFTLVLEDFPDAEPGDEIGGCAVEAAEGVMRMLGRLHAPVFNDLVLSTMDFLAAPVPLNGAAVAALLPAFLERYADQIPAAYADICRRYVEVADAHAADVRPPVGLIHGDFRLDNLLLRPDGECVVVDWQGVRRGPVMADAAYFLGVSLAVADRREHEVRLLRIYHDTLLEHGVANFSWEQCWDEYRRQSFRGVNMAVGASMLVERTQRGDQLFMLMLERACSQVLDLGALELLPADSTPPLMVVDPADEAPHTPSGEAVWNESWYFDAVSEAGDVGIYIRLGNEPNRGSGMYSVAVVRPGQPTVMVTDYACPLPSFEADARIVRSPDYETILRCVAPLEEFEVQFNGTAQQYVDDASPLRGESGDPIALELDLRWTTAGLPYGWRGLTRYEIPCQVAGTVTIAGEEFTFSGPGQRDHSWGPRDWFSGEWLWSAFRLNDGTRVHAVTMPAVPGQAMGYIQKDGRLVEITTGNAGYEPDGDGLVAHTELSIGGSEPMNVRVVSTGFGCLRISDPDGRVLLFTRAMVDVETADGRTGIGWFEWGFQRHL